MKHDADITPEIEPGLATVGRPATQHRRLARLLGYEADALGESDWAQLSAALAAMLVVIIALMSVGLLAAGLVLLAV